VGGHCVQRKPLEIYETVAVFALSLLLWELMLGEGNAGMVEEMDGN